MPVLDTRPADDHAPYSPEGTGASLSSRPYSPLLDVIRIVAVVAVVAVHVIADHVGPESPAAVQVVRSLLAIAVPAFIMISGALNLSASAMRRGTGAFLSRRLQRLVPAAVVWTAFYVLVVQTVIAPQPMSGREEVADLLTATSYPHLYFLPLIIGLTVLTPVLVAFLADDARRTWITGAVAAGWAMAVTATPVLSEGLLGETVGIVQLGALTYFLPFIGYYVLGRAAWLAVPGRNGSRLLLLLAVPALTAATVWAYSSPVTAQPPGQVLLPTYLAPTVMLLSLAAVTAMIGLGRGWTVGRSAERLLRTAGDATFGVFLVHFAILVALREAGFPEASVIDLVMLTMVVTVASFAFALIGKRVPGLRAVV